MSTPDNLRGSPLRRLRFSPLGLLGALILMFLITPFVDELPRGDLIEPLLMSLVLVSAMFGVGARRRTLAVAALLPGPALAGKWGNHLWPHLIHPAAFLIPAIVFIIFVVSHLLRFVLRAVQVDANVLCAGIAAYLMLGLVWALA